MVAPPVLVKVALIVPRGHDRDLAASGAQRQPPRQAPGIPGIHGIPGMSNGDHPGLVAVLEARNQDITAGVDQVVRSDPGIEHFRQEVHHRPLGDPAQVQPEAFRQGDLSRCIDAEAGVVRPLEGLFDLNGLRQAPAGVEGPHCCQGENRRIEGPRAQRGDFEGLLQHRDRLRAQPGPAPAVELPHGAVRPAVIELPGQTIGRREQGLPGRLPPGGHHDRKRRGHGQAAVTVQGLPAGAEYAGRNQGREQQGCPAQRGHDRVLLWVGPRPR